MAPLSVGELLDLLKRSNVLSDEQSQMLRRELLSPAVARQFVRDPSGDAGSPVAGSPPPNAEAILAWLIERGWLTPWQAAMLRERRPQIYLGKYRLLECIGSGGMGAVYKARHERLGRIAALKVMSPTLVANPRAVARFRHEIQAVAALNHPNIVAAYDADYVGKVHFLVMEYVEGHDLGWHVAQQGPLPIDWACECIRQAALGLEHAHERGMIHRDIKPTNLLATTDPESGRLLVKVLDLGLARFATETELEERSSTPDAPVAAGLTQAGQVLGTPDYMSPEQSVDTRRADVRSDIYSLGCTLYRLLTAEMPFPGETVLEKIEARQKGPPRPIRELRPDVPPELAPVLDRMLARDPAARYRAAREVAEALASFVPRTSAPAPQIPATKAQPREPSSERSLLPGADPRLDELFSHLASQADVSPTVAPAAPARRHFRWPFDRKATLSIAAGAAVVLLALAIWYWGGQVTLVVDWPLDQRHGGSLSIDGHEIALKATEKIEVTGRSGPWELKLARPGFETIHERLQMSFGERRPYPIAWHPTPQTTRRTELAAFRRRSAELTKAEALDPQVVRLRAELTRFRSHHAGHAEALEAGGVLAQLPSPLDRLTRVAVPEAALREAGRGEPDRASPALVGALGDGALQFWNRITSVSVSHDGRWIAAASLDGTTRIFDRESGVARHVLVLTNEPTEVLFSPVDDTLAVAGVRAEVTLWNAAKGQLQTTLRGAIRPMAFSGDGRLLAAGAGGRRAGVGLFDVATGKPQRTLTGPVATAIARLSLNADGSRLAVYANAPNVAVVLRDTANDREVGRYPRSHWPRFGADGLLVVGGARGQLDLYDAADGKLKRTIPEGGEPLGFSADGRILVSHRQGRALVWDPLTGAARGRLSEIPALAAVSPDGRTLVAADVTALELGAWDLATGTRLASLKVETTPSSLTFTPDSSEVIAAGGDQFLRRWDPRTGREIQSADALWKDVACDPEGRTVAVARRGEVRLWDLTAAERPVRSLEGDTSQLADLKWSADGQWIAGAGGPRADRTSLRLWEAAGGGELPMPAEHRDRAIVLEFGPGSQSLAAAGEGRSLLLWDAPRREVTRTLEGEPETAALAFDPEGHRLAAAGRSGSVTVWDLKTHASRSFEAQGQGKISVRDVTFSPDGRRLIECANTDLLVRDVTTGEVLRKLACAPAGANCARFSPSGHRLAAAGSTGTVWIWKWPQDPKDKDALPAAEPDEKLAIGPPGGLIRRLFWSLDDRHLLTFNGNSTLFVLRLPAK